MKRYLMVHDEGLNTAKMVEIEDGGWVSYEDYDLMSKYADRLTELSNLPCLPKDLENLRNANAIFAEENFQLKELLTSLRKEVLLATL